MTLDEQIAYVKARLDFAGGAKRDALAAIYESLCRLRGLEH